MDVTRLGVVVGEGWVEKTAAGGVAALVQADRWAEIGPRGSGGRLLDVLKQMLAIDGWDWIPRLLAEGPRVSQSWH